MTGDLLRIVAPLAVGGATLLWTARSRYEAMRRVQDTARSRAASAPQGRVELEGIAWPEDGSAMVAPDGRELVYYGLELQRREHRGSGNHRRVEWVTVARWRHAPDFFLVDASGAVRVAAAEAGLDVAGRRTRAWRALGEGERARLSALLAAHGVSGFPPSTFLFGLFARRFRVVETPIHVGAPIYANGHLVAGDGPREVRALGLAAFHAGVFSGPSSPAGAASATKADRGGDDEARAAANVTMAAAIRDEAKREGRAGDALPLAGRLGASRENPLFVADRHEHQLAGEWRMRVFAPAALGTALVTAAAWLLVGGVISPD